MKRLHALFDPIMRFLRPQANVLYRYIYGQVFRSVTFVMVAFVGLFAFFDLIAEVDRLSEPNTSWLYYFASVFLGLPARVYEIAPIAALIGSIYALVQLAASSEFTAMRAGGLGTGGMVKIMGRIAVGVALITVVFGEVVAPLAETMAVPMRAKALGFEVEKPYRTGYWLRDAYSSPEGLRVRFVNFSDFYRDGTLQGLEYYEVDSAGQMLAWVKARSAEYLPEQGHWVLKGLKRQSFYQAPPGELAAQAGLTAQATPIEQLPDLEWKSSLTPQLLTGLFVRPDRMSAMQLYDYSGFLRSNLQASDDIDLALAKKMVYPLAIVVMMLIALSFAYLHFRSGGVSVRVFVGIMIGVGFHLVNNLFSHLTMVAKLPPGISASLPTLVGLVAGLVALWWVARPAPLAVFQRFNHARH
ncbi:MAG: LPS export ABC transporter permease LptG [Limnobacter sp.]|nr:LPS export ABC transporter permease LptG [Limnobacter sp.]